MWDQEEHDQDTGEVAAQLAHEPMASISTMPIKSGVIADSSALAMVLQSAQALQRSPATLITRAKQIGGLLGGSGFYRFPVGGKPISGPSIDMAQALAQEWGGIAYQVHIMHCESLASGGQRVHLRASVADLKSAVLAEVDQVVSTAPPPGSFATKADQRERWHSMQVQNAASKIVRNAILRVLPAWYVDPAFNAAVDMADKGALGGKSLPDARQAALGSMVSVGCTQAELEQYLDQPLDMWAAPQLGTLHDLYKELKASRLSIEAWRATLTAKQNGGDAPKRSALGLPSASAASPVSVPEATREPAAKRAKAAPAVSVNGELAEDPPMTPGQEG